MYSSMLHGWSDAMFTHSSVGVHFDLFVEVTVFIWHDKGVGECERDSGFHGQLRRLASISPIPYDLGAPSLLSCLFVYFCKI